MEITVRQLMVFVLVACFVLGVFSGWRFRGYCDDNEVDLRSRLRLYRFSPGYIRYWLKTRWQLLHETYCAWRKGLVKLPPGSLRLVSLSISSFGEQLADTSGIPVELFQPSAFGCSLQVAACEPGMDVSITFRNVSDYDFEVMSCFMASTFGNNGMYMLPIPVFVSLSKSDKTLIIQIMQLCRFSKLQVVLPRYVKRPL